ncbi:hypothetical protein RHGRI_010215 [Rhododendron griersonianum]|uniref:Receptor-like serine/threonine-protein kinase n=1 Tax=Rhododendron griersonianum TaxID=479676 RepID=A0AAV6KHN3_9ERIC|nr:hypothetical protein RHGRI_010215 [Rhododendron griersonianum]
MDSSIFLFILPYFFACTLAATSPTILLNSSEPTSWLNDNSIDMNVNSTDGSKVRAILSRSRRLGFVSGFYCTGDCTSYYFGITVVGGGNPAMVWSANPDNPVSENANLTLTREGDLVLRNANGSTVWSTRTEGISVAGLNLTELGNLVLFNETGAVVWQSFDHPTDTLLAGQRLYVDTRLESGLYYATLTTSGLAAYTQVGNESQMYYQLEPQPDTTDQSSQRGRCRLITKTEVNTSDYAELQTGGFLVNMGTSQEPLGSNRSKLPLDSSVEYVRLHDDGGLKLHRHEPATGAKEIVDIVTEDLGVCQHPRQCGDFGVCNEGKCDCPEGVPLGEFQLINEKCSRTTQLCQAPFVQGKLVEMKNVSYFNFIDPTATALNVTDLESCKKACLNNCTCGAAFYRNDTNIDSNGLCYMPSEVLSIRQGEIPNHNFTSIAYIKVEIPANGPAGPPDGSRPPEPRKPNSNRNRLIAIIAGSGSAVLVIFCLLILIFWKKFSKTITEDVEEYLRQVPGMPVMFTHEQLRVATGDFKERLGGGGFGSVFKGELPDGTEIAVKRLYKMGHAVREFLAEVETIGSIHHFNLVRLVGFSADKSCLLVYEYLKCGHSKVTIKVDIYSFGIVLLEIVTGRRNLDGTRSESSKHLLSLMQKKAREDQLLDIVENLNEEMPENREEMLRMIRIAAWCLQNDPTKRPLMSTVVKVLEGVMEVDPSISYNFTHAMGSASVANGHGSAFVANGRVSATQQASVLSNPR